MMHLLWKCLSLYDFYTIYIYSMRVWYTNTHACIWRRNAFGSTGHQFPTVSWGTQLETGRFGDVAGVIRGLYRNWVPQVCQLPTCKMRSHSILLGMMFLLTFIFWGVLQPTIVDRHDRHFCNPMQGLTRLLDWSHAALAVPVIFIFIF